MFNADLAYRKRLEEIQWRRVNWLQKALHTGYKSDLSPRQLAILFNWPRK